MCVARRFIVKCLTCPLGELKSSPQGPAWGNKCTVHLRTWKEVAVEADLRTGITCVSAVPSILRNSYSPRLGANGPFTPGVVCRSEASYQPGAR